MNMKVIIKIGPSYFLALRFILNINYSDKTAFEYLK